MGLGETVHQSGINQLRPAPANPRRDEPLITQETVLQSLELRPIRVEADAKVVEADGG